ncbi:hypothetical protein AAFF_G00238050 [Aldrovandia affinis]|uniref:Ephrin-A1 n=1 Tax=Aldrovandia affinis TaxID=143900 RepID=A0AAD7W413_9TELE|nr:hypothetical protein AAFF_G00238050 [Aldrovandia affinis]
MDLVWLVCIAVSVGACFVSAERHSVFWNSTNPKFWNEYVVLVHLNDYLDIVCPHYPLGEVPSQEAERYVLYMVEREDYDACRPQSYEQLRWECSHPFAPHVPEKFSEKFQRFTPFTLGKEFRRGESYYYISKPVHQLGKECLRLRVDVYDPRGSQDTKVMGGGGGGGEGGVHNPSNRLPADEPVVNLPDVQRSVGASSGVKSMSISLCLSLIPVLISLFLH